MTVKDIGKTKLTICSRRVLEREREKLDIHRHEEVDGVCVVFHEILYVVDSFLCGYVCYRFKLLFIICGERFALFWESGVLIFPFYCYTSESSLLIFIRIHPSNKQARCGFVS